MRVKWIVVHHNGVPGRDIENIRRTHKAKGYRDVGYHYVITEDGTVQLGRKIWQNGAHTKGMNHMALGICVIGNGNKEDFTQAQYIALFDILDARCKQFKIPRENIIGHREVRELIKEGKLDKKYTTRKTCPGTLVDMEMIRLGVNIEE